MMRRGALVAVLVSVVLVLTGCSGIPTSGQVQRSDVTVEPPAAEIEFLPASPVKGDSQEGILRGFIDAASSPQNDFGVARKFLSLTFAVEWDPNASVIIDDGAREFGVTSDTTMTIETDVRANVDSAGGYVELDSPVPATLDFSFVNEEGEWRIASAPPGVLLERITFDQVFGQQVLYFFDPTFTLLVPDVRYFPSRASTPTRIMKALLAGPSAWLGQSGAVVSAFPPGTQLVADTVPITGTSASVDVSAPALDTSAETKRRMLRQAAASLAKLSSIFTVQLSIEGVPQDISAQSDDAAESYPQVDPRPLVISNGRMGYLQSTGSLDEIPRVSDAVASFTPWAAAYSGVHRAATVNTEDGLYLVRSSGSTALVDARENLAPGVFDYYGYIWSVPRELPHDLFASTIGGAKRLVTTPWPDDGRVVSLALSRDGARVAALIESVVGTKLYVSGITRDAQNGPIAVGPPLILPVAGDVATSAVWVDALTVGVLTTQSDITSLITLNVVGGSARSVSPGAIGLNLAAANGIDQFFMRSGDGSLLSYRPGGAWRSVATGVSVQAQVQ
ncbi:unannotated protein [freshwater metagenome]|uniref:Unannotated protein n=1 Tax=freshwater metagenome TaxID=449393 RepID=A0A6J6E615_9ZZZZ|nr:hypothetical protein [Actinomycetota bacterium]